MTKLPKIYLILFGLLGTHLFLLLNLQFTAWPEMSSFPYLFSKGFTIYKDYVHPYPPLLTLILAGVYKIFGYKLLVLKIFTWIMILSNDILIFLITKEISKSEKFAILSLFFYVLTQPFLDGNMLWFDPALTTPILLSTFFGLRFFENKSKGNINLLLTGTFLATAILIKQTAAIFILGFVFLNFIFRNSIKNLFVFLTPLIALIGVFFIWLTKTKSLTDFINWNFIYPATYWTKYPTY